jgi:LmbE family N-acetylglucosaminyl deacetylase
MSQKVLVVAAHPDDEILGCGGTMAAHAANGDQVYTLIVAEGATARDDKRDPTLRNHELDELKSAARRAADVLGTAPPMFLGLPDNRLDEMALLDVIKPIEAAVHEICPAIVYTHFENDLNIDHRVVCQAVLTACRPQPGDCVRAIYSFEVASSTEWSFSQGASFRPARFVDISATLGRKLDALKCYASEMRPFPHARSIEGLEHQARLRGASIGRQAAEAFVVVREIA